MSDAHPAITERVKALFNLINTERVIALDQVHPDFELISPITSVSGEAFRGREGAERWMADIADQFEEFRLVPDDVRASGKQVLVLGRIHLRGRASGLEMNQEAAWLLQLRDD
jgi:ketosteroid isomerase-like protein